MTIFGQWSNFCSVVIIVYKVAFLDLLLVFFNDVELLHLLLGLSSTEEMVSVLQSSTSRLSVLDNDFKFAEPTLALRTVLLQLLLNKRTESNYMQVLEGLVNHLKFLIEIARKAESFQVSEALYSLKHLYTCMFRSNQSGFA